MTTTSSTDENPDDAPRSKTQMLMDNKLKVAGVGQVLADAALLGYGALTGNMKIGSVGLLGWTAGIIGMRYGNPKEDKKLELVERQLGAYLRHQGIEIPKDPTTENLTKQGGVIDTIEAFMHAHPTQLMNVCFGLMGVQFTRSGLQHNQKALLASGTLLMAGALTGLLIQEKKPDPENPPKGVLGNIMSWVEESPLRLAGTLFNLNQVTLAIDALQERSRNPGQKAYMLKLLAVAGFTLCNTMMAMSSKGHGGGEDMDDETREKLAEAAARVITAQPQEVQNGLLDHIAGFLAAQPYIHMKAEEISAMLHKKLAEKAVAPPSPAQASIGI